MCSVLLKGCNKNSPMTLINYLLLQIQSYHTAPFANISRNCFRASAVK